MATVDIGRINAEARDIQPGRVVLTVLAAVLWGIGWTARKTFVVAWLVLAWSWTAVRLGWQEAAPKPRPKP